MPYIKILHTLKRILTLCHMYHIYDLNLHRGILKVWCYIHHISDHHLNLSKMLTQLHRHHIYGLYYYLRGHLNIHHKKSQV